eukprot:GHVS01034291.1.p1 GENE.GHVS01034291.1~~GHVS01034291.1.p1  ORF type:complete len:804 (-),score=172.18 GHVS01034291.1:198-2609(-)
MECLLTFYCKTKGLKYKQGLNEILAPFMLLKYEGNFTIFDAFNCFAAFLSRYLPYAFMDEDFISLQCTFHLFKHLLLYHDPALAVYLAQSEVTPELYLTSWFLTLFASKTKMDVLLCLWDYYIAEDDIYFYCFLSLSLLVCNREELFEVEISQLPETLSRLQMLSHDQLRIVWHSAKLLKQQTPTSFSHRMSTSKGNNKVHLLDQLHLLEAEDAFLLLPNEVLRHSYGLYTSATMKSPTSSFTKPMKQQPSASSIPPPNSSVFSSSSLPSTTTTSRPPLSSSHLSSTWKLLLFDIRPVGEFAAGRLPPAIHLDLTGDWMKVVAELVDDEIQTTNEEDDSIESCGEVENSREQEGVNLPLLRKRRRRNHRVSDHHLCVITSGDDTINEALYVYLILTNDFRLKWVSIASGGYEALHSLAMRSELELVDHYNQEICPVCTPPPIPRHCLLTATPSLLTRQGMYKASASAPSTPSRQPPPSATHDLRDESASSFVGDDGSSSWLLIERGFSAPNSSRVLPFSGLVGAINRTFKSSSSKQQQRAASSSSSSIITSTPRGGVLGVVEWPKLSWGQHRMSTTVDGCSMAASQEGHHQLATTATSSSAGEGCCYFDCYVESILKCTNVWSCLPGQVERYIQQILALLTQTPPDTIAISNTAFSSSSAISSPTSGIFTSSGRASTPSPAPPTSSNNNIVPFVPDKAICHLVLCQDKLVIVSSPCGGGVMVNVYGLYELSHILKITSKKSDGKLLHFYFSAVAPTAGEVVEEPLAIPTARPLLTLRFESDEAAHDCISLVRGIYREQVKAKS